MSYHSTSSNGNAHVAPTIIDSIITNNDGRDKWRRRRINLSRQQQKHHLQHGHCGFANNWSGGSCSMRKGSSSRCSRWLMGAIALQYCLGQVHASTTLTMGGGSSTTNNLMKDSPQQHRRRVTSSHPHPEGYKYNALNISAIDISPLLSSRYEWIRQSPELSQLIDGKIMLKDGHHHHQPTTTSTRDHHRRLDNDDDDDDYVSNYNTYNNNDNDDGASAYVAATSAPTVSPTASPVAYTCESKTCTVNEQCTKFLFGFLQGTTDAKDNCDGIMNAYVAADCGTIKKSTTSSSKSDSSTSTLYNMDDDFNDDYFGKFYEHQCCSSLKLHYNEYCNNSSMLNGYNLLVVAAVMLLCECGKSIVKKNRIRCLPEAAACMLVGMAVALGARVFGTNIENIGFDEEIFMYLLLPPIIFEAALSVNKREFRRRRGSIMVFAVFGTLLSSFITGAATYYSAKYFGEENLSILDSLVFGSLISSIDPVAILSVLTSLKMSETDTIYILVLGESLLNDGIAITLFKSLIQQYQSKSTVTVDDILGSIADFLIISFGSFAIGLACGVACLCYFHLNSSILHPVMEVASFFLWAVVPYWMCEAFDWSGIVAIVVMGFFMDIYLRPGWDPADLELEEQRRLLMIANSPTRQHQYSGRFEPPYMQGLEYYNWEDDERDGRFRFRGTAVDIPRPHLAQIPPQPPAPPIPMEAKTRQESESAKTNKADNLAAKDGDADTVAGNSLTTNPSIQAILMKREFVRMSREADDHVRFVAHILSSLSENAIFAYLGLFLFSSKYKWDAILCSIGVASCILSRAFMVVVASWVIWYIHVFRQRAGCHKGAGQYCIDETNQPNPCNRNADMDFVQEKESKEESVDPLRTPISKSARALSNYKVQVVLILAGLRGAVSLALVENVPIYNGVTGVGSRNKSLLKAMTSSAIIFTIFVLGGGAYYILKWLDISSDDMLIKSRDRLLSYKNGYLYPPLVCGVQNYPETELPISYSLRSQRSRMSHAEISPGHGKFVPPMIDQSRSEWSLTSNYSAGLNEMGQQIPSVMSDIINGGRTPSSQSSSARIV